MVARTRIIGAAGVLLVVIQVAGAQSCTAHTDCAQNNYCDGGMSCYTCSYISPTTCDAFDNDCCSPAFLAQCPTNPAECPPPPPPTNPGPGGTGDDGEGGGTGWTLTILILVSASVYVGGGLGYVRYVSKDEDEDKPLLQNHPHYELWQDVGDYVSDGYVFFRAYIGLSTASEPISSANVDSLETLDEITPPTDTPKTPRKKKLRPKPKPKRLRTSLTQV